MVNIKSSVLNGYHATPVKVECILSRNLPNITIVGMANKAIDESKERVRGAITNSALDIPNKRVIINLAPAEVPKSGSSLDLAIAVAILSASQQINSNYIEDTAFIGELSLEGKLRPVPGILGHILSARKAGIKNIFIPKLSKQQAGLIDGINIIPADSLRHVYQLLHSTDIQAASVADKQSTNSCKGNNYIQLEDIKGQENAKRALIIAMAGKHNLLFSGPPGTGKTMLANAATGLLPAPNKDEIAEITHIHSITNNTTDIITCRPFRAPHHTASQISLIGGGASPKPGEISLAHGGVLFLDELLEFTRHSIESLRQPLENGSVNISRAAGSVRYPADFILIGALNPCPCGFIGDNKHECSCTPQAVFNYQRKLSGPMLDRFDQHVHLQRLDFNDKNYQLITTAKAKEQISKAWSKQLERNHNRFNSQLSLKELENSLLTDKTLRSFYIATADKLALSTRAFVKILRLSRTIADIEESELVSKAHILEALSYRQILKNQHTISA